MYWVDEGRYNIGAVITEALFSLSLPSSWCNLGLYLVTLYCGIVFVPYKYVYCLGIPYS